VSGRRTFVIRAGLLIVLAFAAASSANAQYVVDVLHSFDATGSDGKTPTAALVRATDGNLYGTTSQGGLFGFGTVFRITTDGTFTTLYSFDGKLGKFPVAGLVQADDGYLYGVTKGEVVYFATGIYFNVTPATIFRVDFSGAVTLVHVFPGSRVLIGSVAPLIQGRDGSLYGMIRGWSRYVYGFAYKLSLDGTVTELGDLDGDTGGWSEGGLVEASDGNFYGTSTGFPFSATAAVFRMSPAGTISVVHKFDGDVEGEYPRAGLAEGPDGNLYGTTSEATNFRGAVFRMTPGGTMTVLHQFADGVDGSAPSASLLLGRDGAFYGTTVGGGASSAGTIFRITPQGEYSVVHSFTGADGDSVSAALIQLPDGSFYGTTSRGGANNTGVIFRFRSTAPNPRLTIDGPANGEITGASIALSGWAADFGAAAGTGVDAIHVYLTPSGGTPQFAGVATYGEDRPDVAAFFGNQYAASGYSLDVTAPRAGTYTLTAFAHSTVSGTFAIADTRTVTVVSRPLMNVDGPAPGSSVGQSFTIAGWAIDRSASTGAGVDAVHVYAFPPGGGAPTFLGVGTPTLRNDVGAIFGPRFADSGFVLGVAAGTLAAGSYQLVVYARSTVTGTFNDAVAIAVTVLESSSNPMLYVDTPAPGATIGGMAAISGWALDLGASSGTGVTAIHVWALPTSGAPGTFLGAATYSLPRPDVGAIFGARFTDVGYSLMADVSALAPGSYNLVVFGFSTVTNGFTFARAVPVTK
jgi:uncharacterized repeat protein (TIGR03803 family)